MDQQGMKNNRSSSITLQNKTESKELNFRTKGANKQLQNGKIYKGFVNDAFQKSSIGSIPAKHEHIVHQNKINSGFGTGTIRFQNSQTLTPGPGNYNLNQINQQLNNSISNKQNSVQDLNVSIQNTSILTDQYYQNTKKDPVFDKGFGRVERNPFGQKYIQQSPGVGSYDANNEFKILRKRSHNTKGDPQFQNQDAFNKFPQVTIPGPGYYNIDVKKHSNPFYSSFKTNTERNKLGINDTPSVGIYELERNILEKKNYKHNGFSSNFQSEQGKKRVNKDLQLKIIRNYLSEKNNRYIGSMAPILEEKINYPAVGDYSTEIPDMKPNCLKNQLNSGFLDGLKDRFGDFYDKNLEKDPMPGPQKYQKEKYGFDQIAKQQSLVSGSAFLSESQRLPYGELDKKLGPSMSVPNFNEKSKRSFLLNIERKWV